MQQQDFFWGKTESQTIFCPCTDELHKAYNLFSAVCCVFQLLVMEIKKIAQNVPDVSKQDYAPCCIWIFRCLKKIMILKINDSIFFPATQMVQEEKPPQVLNGVHISI